MRRSRPLVALASLLAVLVIGVEPSAAAVVTITPAGSPTALDNDYTRINAAIQSAADGDTIKLDGTFDWTEPFAAASWALGNDGTASTFDDYSVYVPANLNSVTLTADTLGDGTIQGPGDLAAVNLEGVLVFDGGDNQNWTISNLRFLDFDLSIGFFNGAGGDDAFNDTHITDNYIRLARDLNATVAPADVNQNIGLHFSYGTNIEISGNTIDIEGDGVSDGSNTSADVGMQSNVSGGAIYDGLRITDNIVRVLNAQSANPETVLGIWEEGHAHTSEITVSGNQFLNQAPGNNPAANLQRGFRVTSHSSATTDVSYEDNTVEGANIGFEWRAGSNFSGNQRVFLAHNTIIDGGTGVLVQSRGRAELGYNRIVGNSVAGVNNVDGIVTAENNWWGCNAGPGNAGCDSATGRMDSDPWLVLGVSASPNPIPIHGTSTITADMKHNSDTAATPSWPPPTPVGFSATQGTIAPPTGTIMAGQASATFTSTSFVSGTGCATVDSQLTCANVVVTPDTTAPTPPTPHVSPPPNAAGWNKSNVTVSFTPGGDEGGSGVASCTGDQFVTAETPGQVVSGTCTDNAGNVSSPRSVTVRLDKTVPDTTITKQPPATTNSTNAAFKFTSSEGSSSFECKLAGDPWAPCTSAKTYNGLSAGTRTFRVRATDQAGNRDQSAAEITWTIDLSVPNTTITAHPPASTSSHSASFSFSSNEGGSTFKCKRDGAASFTSCTNPKTYTGLSPGSHTFRVQATDPAGNTDGSPAVFTWTIT